MNTENTESTENTENTENTQMVESPVIVGKMRRHYLCIN
jgi:hypothetical protein